MPDISQFLFTILTITFISVSTIMLIKILLDVMYLVRIVKLAVKEEDKKENK
jgi:hypothetical protein